MRWEISIIINTRPYKKEFFHESDFLAALDDVKKAGVRYLAHKVERELIK